MTYKELKDFYNGEQPVILETKLCRYNDVSVISLIEPSDLDTEGAMQFEDEETVTFTVPAENIVSIKLDTERLNKWKSN